MVMMLRMVVMLGMVVMLLLCQQSSPDLLYPPTLCYLTLLDMLA